MNKKTRFQIIGMALLIIGILIMNNSLGSKFYMSEVANLYILGLTAIIFFIIVILKLGRRNKINNKFACKIDPAMNMNQEENGWLGHAICFLDSNPGKEFTGQQIAEGLKIEEGEKAFLESDKFAYHMEAFNNFTIRKTADGSIYYSYHKPK